MKTIKITLRESGVNLYTVEKFSNTAQLTVGMTVDRSRLESWAGMARVQFDVLPPVKAESVDCEQIELGSDVQTIASETEFDAESGGGVQERAREFDAAMFELAGLHGWSDDGTLAAATVPDAGNDNLGTIGIKGNIERSKALAIVRRNAAKQLGLNADEIGKLAYRAECLPVLKAFGKLLNAGNNQPF